MPEILPAINCHYKDLESVAARCKEIGDIFTATKAPAPWAHFDVADAAFTFHKSWDDPELLGGLGLKFAFEAHLMVEDPHAAAGRWLAAGAGRVVVHLETVPPEALAKIAAAAQAKGAGIALALNPETPAAAAVPYFPYVSRFLLLAVHPGLSGQRFLPVILDKISFLRREMPGATIEIDGGITPETARAAVSAGADALVSGSYVLDSADPAQAYAELGAIQAII
jgi:ribulose-phosphate 3-epimerase